MALEPTVASPTIGTGLSTGTGSGAQPPVNAALAYLATLHSPTSRKSMASKLNMLARWAGYADLRVCPPPVNAALAYLATLHSPTSRKSMASKLNMLARWAGYADLRACPWGELKTEHVLAFLAGQEKEGKAGSTSNCYLAAIKGVAKAAWLARSMSHEDYLRIESLKQRRFYRLPTGL